ncbi:MAG: proline racemase family protein [Peptococcaceae bacterium]|nr:proline racemase family protein [Peptococcaceae bacterium]
MFTTIDTHTAGEPTRTIIGGIPYIPGKTVSEKMLHLKEKEDWIRKILMYEPRGNDVMSGVILTEPCTPGADIGVIFIEVGGYLPMCGHDTIGVSTALIEAGIIKPVEPYTFITLDTPAGLVQVKVRVDHCVAKEVTFVNVPAFVFAGDVEVDVPSIGAVKLDISYGGNYYAIVRSADVGLDVRPEEAGKIIRLGNMIKDAVNRQVEVYHPEKPFINEVTHVAFSAPPTRPGAAMKNAVVIPPGSIDRSPCGTGTAAKLACLYAKGELGMNEVFVHESIIGTTFACRVLEETKVGEFPAVIPEITGQAFVTGMHTFVIDPDDPVTEGFRLGQEG